MDRADIIQMMRKSVFPVRDQEGRVVGTCFAAAGGNFFSCRQVFYDDCNREYPDLTVELDGQDRKPDFQYSDLESDTAILRFAGCAPEDFIELGDFDKVREGDNVLFIGFPLGATHHVTHHGMVSAKWLIQNCVGLQIDASVNRGNSGGPCIAMQNGRPVCVGIIASRLIEFDSLKNGSKPLSSRQKEKIKSAPEALF